MKYDLKDFKKLNKKNEYIVTTISITTEQKKFLEEKGLNASELIRSFLNDLIKIESKKEVV